MKLDNRRVITVLVFLSLLFLSLIGYLLCFPLLLSEPYTENAFDPRVRAEEARVLRGSIYDRKGMRLAYSERTEQEKQRRRYPYGNRYVHTIGYCSSVYGKVGLELAYNKELSGKQSFSKALFEGETEAAYGADVYTTLDNALQEKAESLLWGVDGAIVVLNPKNGAILALASSPSFSPAPSDLEANWDALCTDPSSPLLNRATQGIYAPGSVFKIITLCGAIEGGLEGQLFEDTGVYSADGKEIRNAGDHVFGTISLQEAFSKSANTVFADIAVRLGEDNMKKLMRRFGVEAKIPLEIPVGVSKGAKSFRDEAELAAVGIGQGTLAVTPLYMALVAGAVANDGVMMMPYLTEQVVSMGKNIQQHEAKALRTVMEENTANTVRAYMQAVVAEGTGTAAATPMATVYGKTGTAENETEQTHAWFVGFAENGTKDGIAFAVLRAYSGASGGSVCAPMARELVNTWFAE